MKKLITLTAALFMIAGCAGTNGYSTKIENANENAVSGTNLSITNQELFENLMDQYGANYVLNQALQKIAGNYELDEEALKAEVENTINTYKTFMGDDLDAYAKNNLGYDTFAEYQEKVLEPSLRQKKMIEDYSEQNFDTLASQYYFKKLSMIVVEDESTAISLIGKISNNELSFEDAVSEYSIDSTTKAKKGDMGVVSDLSTNVAENIIAILPQLTVNGLYSVPVEVNNGYAIINVVETDITVFQDEILDALKNSDKITKEAESYYLHENGFKVYDDRLKENLQAINADYIK